MTETSLIVIGMLNTDIFAHGLDNFPAPNNPIYGGKLKIGPGGKPGNIASMAARLMPANSVAMLGRTVRDPYDLWRLPIEGLEKAGVNTDFIKILNADQTDKFPSVAMGGVDKDGNNLFFVLPGVSDDFSPQDIDDAEPLFEAAAQNNGILALTLECPLPTTLYAAQKAKKMNIRIVLDPGGITGDVNAGELLSYQPFFIKPNEFEAERITGIQISGFDSARLAADKLKELGAQNVLITHGEHGAYLFAGSTSEHIQIPKVRGSVRDATGCGDQSMAALCARILAGRQVEDSAKAAVLAGTLQFYKQGCQPLDKAELEPRL